jgi:chemotaxis signal transduction protein
VVIINTDWNWKAHISVGSIKLGENALSVIDMYGLVHVSEQDPPEQQAYQFLDKTVIIVDKNIITSISCKASFLYKHKNFIGLSINEVREIIGKESSIDIFLKMRFVSNLTRLI